MGASEQQGTAVRRNTRLFIAGETLWGFQTALVGAATVMTVLLREYGATETMIGAISSIDACGLLLPQTLGVFMFASQRTRKRDIVIWHFVGIIPWLCAIGCLAALAPRMALHVVAWGVLICYGFYVSGIGVVAGVWTDWIAHLFPVQRRGRVMGWSWGASSLAGIMGALLAGELLRHDHSHMAYALLYGAAGSIAAASIATFCWVTDPASSRIEERRRLRVMDVVHYACTSMRNRNFRVFIMGRVLAMAGFSIVPLITLYYLAPEGGSVEKSTLVSVGAMLGAGFAVGNMVAGSVGDRHGHRAGTVSGVVLQLLALTVLLATRGVWSCGIVYALAGASLGMTNIAHSNMLFETCPHDRRIVHITFGNIVLGLCTTLLPLIAGRIAHVYGMRMVMVISAGCSVVALGWLARYLREPRAGGAPRTPGLGA